VRKKATTNEGKPPGPVSVTVDEKWYANFSDLDTAAREMGRLVDKCTFDDPSVPIVASYDGETYLLLDENGWMWERCT
jgi:hypothetical protein